MNKKASVSEELNAKHKKILEGLLKLPGNKICADCKSRGPRWASVNLGVFICMQCSGIHRSMGTHISKVRSAALDTWLPEQVAFIQTMGNEKANSYWEAELPPNYDRVGIENFIRAKYEDKRWVPRNSSSISSFFNDREDRAPESKETVNERHTDKVISDGEQNNQSPQDARKPYSAIPKLPTPGSGLKVQPVVPKPGSQQPSQTETTESSKVDKVTDLFDMFSIDDPQENESQLSSADDTSWANFQSVEVMEPNASTNGRDSNGPKELKSQTMSEVEDLFGNSSQSGTAGYTESKPHSTSGIEDLFGNSIQGKRIGSADNFEHEARLSDERKSQSVSSLDSMFQEPTSAKSQSSKDEKNVKDDILNLFNKSDMVSPFALHQQQLAYLSQQQAFLLAAAKSNQQSCPTSTTPTSYQIPGMTSFGSQAVKMDANNISQIQSGLPSSVMLYNPYQTLSIPTMDQSTKGTDGHITTETGKPSASSSSNEYDFSSLVDGMFTKKS